ncbi:MULTISPECIES: nuclear transport factor 2 family protein [unclassified Rhodococcus (in: high G+C Gram-positive bacteria)]|uniref:nuclear transport factor 2 family protein n=1 Tax=unclassified Rhodococcus (in: high G+C Gram-positive bacteria) TaxID=192944 RepID=UPI00163AC308|nr:MULTISPECIES: nuclear transport factor 2 family protein [unclassified Rhodococcus (in: high G+C Gram-positive bacteria)]MBC2640899.1 nuclear transport factor 2 family protein [Rhodococcus sp. 3A]MBC2894357.1 nuclear transport factor 2 family protein [Rhodococcus sp. 4CII]
MKPSSTANSGAELSTVDRVVVESELSATLHRYCRGLDRRDSRLLDGIFWPDSTVRYSSADDISGPDFVSQILPTFERRGIEMTHHMIGNVLTRIWAHVAYSESYLRAFHRVVPPGKQPYDLIIGGRFQDRFEQRNGDWKIARRVLVFDWFRECADAADWTVEPRASDLNFTTAVIGSPGRGPWSEFEDLMSGVHHSARETALEAEASHGS